jgi:CRISPR/Cas system type I-B associated protein Csh2 (Cas7 group RAMP superfamily)
VREGVAASQASQILQDRAMKTVWIYVDTNKQVDPGCGQWFDIRDLGQVLAHVHDPEIDISEGPDPPREGRPP